MRDANRESGGYDASRGGDAAECGSDCGGRYAQQHKAPESFRNQDCYDKLP